MAPAAMADRRPHRGRVGPADVDAGVRADPEPRPDPFGDGGKGGTGVRPAKRRRLRPGAPGPTPRTGRGGELLGVVVRGLRDREPGALGGLAAVPRPGGDTGGRRVPGRR